MLRILFVHFVFFAGILLGIASPLAIELKALAVTEDPEGKAQFKQVEEAQPGQLLEYRATFSNTSEGVLHAVAPEIPIPEGMTLVLGSIEPKQYTVSADGRQFAAFPLLDATGKPLGPESVRAVRWAAASIPADGTITARLRVKVNE